MSTLEGELLTYGHAYHSQNAIRNTLKMSIEDKLSSISMKRAYEHIHYSRGDHAAIVRTEADLRSISDGLQMELVKLDIQFNVDSELKTQTVNSLMNRNGNNEVELQGLQESLTEDLRNQAGMVNTLNEQETLSQSLQSDLQNSLNKANKDNEMMAKLDTETSSLLRAQRELQQSVSNMIHVIDSKQEEITCETSLFRKLKSSENLLLEKLRAIIINIKKIESIGYIQQMESAIAIGAGLESRCKALEESLSCSRKSVSDHESTAHRVTSECESLSRELSKLDGSILHRAIELEKLRSDFSTARSREAEILKMIASAESCVKDFEFRVETLRVKSSSQGEQYRRQNEELDIIKLKQHALGALLAGKSQRRRWARRSHSPANTPIVTLQIDGPGGDSLVEELCVNQILIKCQSTEEPIPALVHFISTLVDRLSRATQELAHIHSDMQNLIGKVSNLRREISSIESSRDVKRDSKVVLWSKIIPHSIGSTVLNFTSMHLTGHDIVGMLDSPILLPHKASIREALLAGNHIKDDDIDIIMRLVEAFQNLTRINLCRNRITPNGFERLRVAMHQINGVTGVLVAINVLVAQCGTFSRLTVDVTENSGWMKAPSPNNISGPRIRETP